MHHILLDNLQFILNVYDFIYNSLSTKQNLVLGKKHILKSKSVFFNKICIYCTALTTIQDWGGSGEII